MDPVEETCHNASAELQDVHISRSRLPGLPGGTSPAAGAASLTAPVALPLFARGAPLTKGGRIRHRAVLTEHSGTVHSPRCIAGVQPRDAGREFEAERCFGATDLDQPGLPVVRSLQQAVVEQIVAASQGLARLNIQHLD